MPSHPYYIEKTAGFSTKMNDVMVTPLIFQPTPEGVNQLCRYYTKKYNIDLRCVEEKHLEVLKSLWGRICGTTSNEEILLMLQMFSASNSYLFFLLLLFYSLWDWKYNISPCFSCFSFVQTGEFILVESINQIILKTSWILRIYYYYYYFYSFLQFLLSVELQRYSLFLLPFNKQREIFSFHLKKNKTVSFFLLKLSLD